MCELDCSVQLKTAGAVVHVAKVLGHADDSITSVYDRSSYSAEKRVALQRWADQLRAIVAGKDRKVVPIAKELRA